MWFEEHKEMDELIDLFLELRITQRIPADLRCSEFIRGIYEYSELPESDKVALKLAYYGGRR